MALIDYRALQRLVAEHDTLTAQSRRREAADAAETTRRLDDVLYTIGVYTGLRNPEQAVARARMLLAKEIASTARVAVGDEALTA